MQDALDITSQNAACESENLLIEKTSKLASLSAAYENLKEEMEVFSAKKTSELTQLNEEFEKMKEVLVETENEKDALRSRMFHLEEQVIHLVINLLIENLEGHHYVRAFKSFN